MTDLTVIGDGWIGYIENTWFDDILKLPLLGRVALQSDQYKVKITRRFVITFPPRNKLSSLSIICCNLVSFEFKGSHNLTSLNLQGNSVLTESGIPLLTTLNVMGTLIPMNSVRDKFPSVFKLSMSSLWWDGLGFEKLQRLRLDITISTWKSRFHLLLQFRSLCSFVLVNKLKEDVSSIFNPLKAKGVLCSD